MCLLNSSELDLFFFSPFDEWKWETIPNLDRRKISRFSINCNLGHISLKNNRTKTNFASSAHCIQLLVTSAESESIDLACLKVSKLRNNRSHVSKHYWKWRLHSSTSLVFSICLCQVKIFVKANKWVSNLTQNTRIYWCSFKWNFFGVYSRDSCCIRYEGIRFDILIATLTHGKRTCDIKLHISKATTEKCYEIADRKELI